MDEAELDEEEWMRHMGRVTQQLRRLILDGSWIKYP